MTLARIRASAIPRLIDRAAGAPVLWLLGACRRRRQLPAAPRRFGIMMFETIGDTVLAGTLVASIRAKVAGAELVVFASRGNRAAVELFDGISAVVEVPLTRPLEAVRAIRSIAVDVMIDIGQWPRWYALLCAASRSRYTIGFATPGQARHHAYDAAVPHGSDVHELDNFQRLLVPLSPITPIRPSAALAVVNAPPSAIERLAPYAVLHPWASGFRYASREWPVSRWQELIIRLCQMGLSVVVSGSPADRPKANALVDSCGPELPVTCIAGEVSLRELAAVLKSAAAVVSVNTGVMHLASLLDAPLVALHGPTSRRRWGPVGARSIALAPPEGVPCEYLHLGFEYPSGRVDCMEHISVEQVFAAVRDVMALAETEN
jgi:ADP-heptose:LPS heptosyltransferase